MKNNLANDPSPYLQQHKDNPVHWQTWGKESLELAAKEKKPILLSVGYASCHWCHVMAHESFEDPESADLMNKYFINIKVDREERPDLDFLYQSSFQLFNQTGGGWPLTMFLDENGVPFMGGTYFPKIENHGLPSFKNVIKKVSEVYKIQREKIMKQQKIIIKSLELKKNAVLDQDLEPIVNTIIDNLDHKKGGYKGAPKFPTFNVFDTLLYFYNKTKNKKFLDPVELVIKKLCSEGIYDHVEGGIARYTVDEDWLVPHFEKMLYDNAQFISLLSNFCKIRPSKYLKLKISQTVNFIIKNFSIKSSGLLGSAYDADSEGKEGKYYVFEYNELKNIENIKDYFDIQPSGNWEGKIILKEIKYPPDEIIQKLIKIREKKIKPFFDNKIQLDLNSLWINALVHAHEAFPKEGYLDLAEKFFISLEKQFDFSKLHHSNFKNIVFLEDYANLINALISLSENTMNTKYILEAKKICDLTIRDFLVKDKNIFQKNKLNSTDLFFNPIDISDHTIPNGNSIMLRNLVKLGYEREGKDLAKSLNGYLNIYKSYMTSSIKSLDFYKSNLQIKKCDDQGCKI